MDTVKTTKREPNKKVLNQNLADKKALYEAEGWAFEYDETLGWEAGKDGEKVGHFLKLENLLIFISERKKTPEIISPAQKAESWLIENYFDDFDILQAKKTDNPAEYLRKKGVYAQRSFGGNGVHYETIRGGKVQAWVKPAVYNKNEPTLVVTLKKLAQMVVKSWETPKQISPESNLGDIPRGLQKEKSELEEKGWAFISRGGVWDLEADGVVFKDYESLAQVVEVARSLQGTRERGETDKLKEIALEREVEKLCVLRFKADLAQLAYENFDPTSDGLGQSFDEWNSAADAFAQTAMKAIGSVSTKQIENFARMYKLQGLGWMFSLDEKNNWGASKIFSNSSDGAKGFNSLERLLSWCEKKDEKTATGEADAEVAVGGFGNEKLEETSMDGSDGYIPATEDDLEKLETYKADGWAIERDNDGLWSSEKVINEKHVFVGKHAYLSALFAHMDTYSETDRAMDVKPGKPLETLPTSEIKKVKFELTDEDVLLKNNTYLENLRVISKKKSELDELKKMFNKELEKLAEKQEELVDEMELRIEFRPVECSVEYDLAHGEKVYYRPDTGEQIDRSSMTKDELRIALAAAERAKQPGLF